LSSIGFAIGGSRVVISKVTWCPVHLDTYPQIAWISTGINRCKSAARAVAARYLFVLRKNYPISRLV